MEIGKPLLIKVLGGSAVAAPTVGAGTYAIITQQEFEELNLKIKTLEAKNSEQEKNDKVSTLEQIPENQNRETDQKQDLGDLEIVKGEKQALILLLNKVKEELATEKAIVRSYKTTKNDPYAMLKELIKSLVKQLRDNKFNSGYDSYPLQAGILYGWHNYFMIDFCKKKDGGITMFSSRECVTPRKKMTLKELEDWSKS